MTGKDDKIPPFDVNDYKSWGGGGREEVAGGPAGRGNDGKPAGKTGRDWGRGDMQEGDDGIPEADKPVADQSGGEKNPFSR
jgi:hypothetical protein